MKAFLPITVRKRDDPVEYLRQYGLLNRRNKDLAKEGTWRRKYGLTREGYNKLLEEQDNKCSICGAEEPGGKNIYFHVDHCHAKGHVRGLLCGTCNQGLGNFKDKIENLESAAEYLQRTG